jgi:hypothetical protein
MKLGDYSRADICDALAGKVGAEAKALAADLATRFGASLGYIYKISKEARGARREVRGDRGQRKIALAPEIEDFMLGLTLNADMSADSVVWIAARHFGLDAEFMSTVTYNRWLRQKRMSRTLLKKDLRPYRAFEAPRANILHHYDTTVAEAFYANDDGTIGREAKHERYKNKPGNKRPRLILYSLIDDHSRVIFARFYFSENTLNLLDFCFRAWSAKDDSRFPFFGIPEHLYADAGAPLRSRKFTHAAEKLGVAVVGTTPSHATEFGSRKHGKIERSFGEGLLGEFMKITTIYKFAALAEMNDCLHEWLIHLNGKLSRATGKGRFVRWSRTVGTPRSMPTADMFKLLHYDRVERVVARNLQIQLNGKVFQLPLRKPFINWVDAKIECYWYPGHEEAISVVYDHHEEEIRALAPVLDIALEFKSIEKTAREEKLEALKEQKYAAVNFPQIYTDRREVNYLPRPAEEFDDKKIAEKYVDATGDGQPATARRPSFAPERWLSRIEAILDLQRRDFFQRPPSAGDQTWLKDLMREREKISETELTDAIILSEAQLENEEATDG